MLINLLYVSSGEIPPAHVPVLLVVVVLLLLLLLLLLLRPVVPYTHS